MNGREAGSGAQVAPGVAGKMNREVGTGEFGTLNHGTRAGVDEAEAWALKGQDYDADRVRGIGGLAMGQVLTYNPEVADNVRSGVGATRPEAGAPEFGLVQNMRSGSEAASSRPALEAIQGRDVNEMMGVAGENLQQLGHLSRRAEIENERVREQAEIEDGYARNEIAPNLSSVGLASAFEEAERRTADVANARGEVAPETFDDKIQNKSQEEIGKVAAAEIGDLQRQKSFSPARVAKLRDEWMEKMLAAFKNPRKFKERNG